MKQPLVSDKTIEKWSEGISMAAIIGEEIRDVYEHHICEGRLKWVDESEPNYKKLMERVYDALTARKDIKVPPLGSDLYDLILKLGDNKDPVIIVI
jgi:hypothetical protein